MIFDAPAHRRTGLRSLGGAVSMLETLGRLAAPPVLRVALALPFVRSGLTRWDPFPTLSIGTQFLFEEQFKLHLWGHAFGIPAPLAAAYVTAVAEIALPLLLLAGLATRFAALGLLLMTGVIQLVVPEGWANFHLYWAGLALGLIALGAGPVSLDALVAKIARASRAQRPRLPGEPYVER
jgi:putative oxidoreductase